jgi:hypothetical protein
VYCCFTLASSGIERERGGALIAIKPHSDTCASKLFKTNNSIIIDLKVFQIHDEFNIQLPD